MTAAILKMPTPPLYTFRARGLDGTPMKVKLIEMMEYGFHIGEFDIDESARVILNVLETKANLLVSDQVRAEVLETISAYCRGLHAVGNPMRIQ